MYETELQQVGFYASVYAIAFAASVARVLRMADVLLWRSIVSMSATSGFLAFGMCSFLVTSAPDNSWSAWRCRGLAALLGLLVREQDAILRWAFTKFVTLGKNLFDEEK